MLRICFLRTDIDIVSGATRATLELAEAFAATPGFEVHIISIYGGTASESGTDEQREESESLIHFFRLNPGAARLREDFFKVARRLREYIRVQQIDIVFSVGISPVFTLSYALRGLGIKKVLIEHSSRSNTAEYGLIDDLSFRLMLKGIDEVVVLTERDHRNYLDSYHVAEQRVHVIPNWIGADALEEAGPYDSSLKALITVGRPSKVKGFDLLAQVAAQLKPDFPDWRWDIFGEGELFDEVKQWIADAGVQEFVFLKGNDPEVLKRYQEYSIFVMTSYFEGLPLSLLEAVANHLPSVAFDCPTGPREVIRDGVDGFLIPCYETETMAAKLAELMRDESLRGRFSTATWGGVEKFSKGAVFAKWLGLIDALGTKARHG